MNPKVPLGPCRPRTYSLDELTVTMLTVLGDGNVSAGIRAADVRQGLLHVAHWPTIALKAAATSDRAASTCCWARSACSGVSPHTRSRLSGMDRSDCESTASAVAA